MNGKIPIGYIKDTIGQILDAHIKTGHANGCHEDGYYFYDE